MKIEQLRYHTAAITLHWVMAVSIFLMLASGLSFNRDLYSKSLQFSLIQWHKSLGLLLLMAFFLRISLRYILPRPALSEKMKAWEKFLAHVGHMSMYVVMLILPLSGWIMVSSSPLGLPTYIFGLFEWPHIPFVEADKVIEEYAFEAHWILAYTLIFLIATHVAAVVKHWLFDKENLLPRMGIGRMKKEKRL